MLFVFCILMLTGCKKQEQVVLDTEITVDEVEENQPAAVKDLAPIINNDEKLQDNDSRRVVCWGDSMTEGTGGNGVTFPDSIAKYGDVEVLNYGVYGETTKAIAAREGAYPQVTSDTFVIPADTVPVRLTVNSKTGEWLELLDFGNSGINPCKVGDIEGTWYFDEERSEKCFVRSEPGEEITIEGGTPLITHAMQDKRPDDIWVIWSGNNERPKTEEEVRDIIKWQRAMLEDGQISDYLIISLTSKEMLDDIDMINRLFESEYGEHYFDLRQYALSDMIKDAGIEPTEQDLKDVENGHVPSSLRSDVVHGNEIFYDLAGKMIYEKLVEMGYLKGGDK